MKVIRKRLSVDDVLPPLTRYDPDTDTVQTFDGTGWIDTPERDPRTNNSYPPPATANPRCDGAARMSAFLQAIVDSIIDGVDANKNDAEIALVILGILVIIPLIDLLYVLIASLVGALIIVGSTWLHDAFDAFDWDELTCIIYENANTEGFITDAGLAALKAQITADLDTDPASVLNDILNIVGRGGMNDAAALRDEEGDCSECPDTWTITLTPDNVADLQTSFWGGNTLNCSNGLSYQGQRGEIREESGVNVWNWTLLYGTRGVQVSVRLPLPVGTDLRTFLIAYSRQSGSQCLVTLNIPAGRVYCFVNPNGESVGIADTLMITGDGLIHELVATANNNSASHVVYIRQLILGGHGPSPVFQET